MSPQPPDDEATPSLHRSWDGLGFFWDDPPQGEEGRVLWRQLFGGMHRLATVREELQSAGDVRDIERCLLRLEHGVESYLVRAYELRDRALKLLATRVSTRGEVENLRHKAERQAAAEILTREAPALTDAVVRLVAFLDEDVKLRNRLTHHNYLILVQYTDRGPVLPYDELAGLEQQSAQRRRFVSRLRRDVRTMTAHYAAKATAVIDLTKAVVDAAERGPRGPVGDV